MILWIVLHARKAVRSLPAKNVINILSGAILFHAQILFTICTRLISLTLSLTICLRLSALSTFHSAFLAAADIPQPLWSI